MRKIWQHVTDAPGMIFENESDLSISQYGSYFGRFIFSEPADSNYLILRNCERCEIKDLYLRGGHPVRGGVIILEGCTELFLSGCIVTDCTTGMILK